MTKDSVFVKCDTCFFWKLPKIQSKNCVTFNKNRVFCHMATCLDKIACNLQRIFNINRKLKQVSKLNALKLGVCSKINACYIIVCIFFQICQNSNF